MKKYMVVCFVSLLTFLQVTGMDSEKGDPSIPNSDMYCLQNLSPDILNCIVNFLVWESDKQFIERTQEIDVIPDQYYIHFKYDAGMCTTCKNSKKKSGSFSPDQTKIALFETALKGNCAPESKVLILDVQNEKKIIFDENIERKQHCSIGVSSSANMITFLKKQKTYAIGEQYIPEKSNYIMIRKKVIEKKLEHIDGIGIVEKEVKLFKDVKKIEISSFTKAERLAFNKQGTHIIMYAEDTRPEKNNKFHRIFTLKKYNIDDNSMIDDENSRQLYKENMMRDNENELQNYFRHYGICKKMIQNIK